MQPIETSQKKYPSTCYIIKKEKDDNQNMIGNRCGVISTHQRELDNGLPFVARPTSAAKEKNQGNECLEKKTGAHKIKQESVMAKVTIPVPQRPMQVTSNCSLDTAWIWRREHGEGR
jgi:hypothetical protein